jgi:hypothetical protein
VLVQIADQIDQLLDRPAQPVELPDDQSIAFAQHFERLGQARPVCPRATHLVSKTFLHPALLKASRCSSRFDPASRRAHSQSTWLVSRPVDAFLHRLHHFFVGVRSGVGVGGLPQGFSTSRHPLVILRPQRLLHAQRRLTQQVQQAEQPHVVGGDDALPICS